MEENKETPSPSPVVALLLGGFLVAAVCAAVAVFGSRAMEGAIQLMLLAASAVTCFIGMAFYDTKWRAIEKCLMRNVGGVSVAIMILIAIGILCSVWMMSGIVPTLIYYGLEIISPKLFLFTCCLICMAVSLVTGSSWTTVATVGLAMMGIGRAMGFSDGWIAGAIISGAYVGDKISPLSDTTVLASTVCEVPLYTHIRYMMVTTIPSVTIALAVFFVAGMTHLEVSDASMEALSLAIRERFVVSPWLLMVPLVTAALILKKTPVLITLTISSIIAMIVCATVQPALMREIAGGGSVARGLMTVCCTHAHPASSNEILERLIATGGMAGMLNTVWLVVCAVAFGAAMQATGMLAAITAMFVRLVDGAVSLVVSSVFSGILLNLISSDQYVSIILGGKMFVDVFKKRGLDGWLLSRTVEDSTTVTSVLVPWNSCGMTQATVLGVATLAYLPYAVFCYISPVVSILVAAIKYKPKVRRYSARR